MQLPFEIKVALRYIRSRRKAAVSLITLITIGGVVCFYLWIWALEHTMPSRVSIAVTLNPISAALLGALLLAEPLTGRLAAGLVAVVIGLALANWPARSVAVAAR